MLRVREGALILKNRNTLGSSHIDLQKEEPAVRPISSHFTWVLVLKYKYLFRGFSWTIRDLRDLTDSELLTKREQVPGLHQLTGRKFSPTLSLSKAQIHPPILLLGFSCLSIFVSAVFPRQVFIFSILQNPPSTWLLSKPLSALAMFNC